MSTAAAEWVERAARPEDIDALSGAVRGCTPLARVLAGRHVAAADAPGFLDPRLGALGDPSRLKGVDEAVERLVHALVHEEVVGIFGDYDVDGVTSTTVLWDVLEAVGGKVVATLPDRLVEGYGLSRAGIDRLAAAGARLVVTVDCGVTAHDEVRYAVDKGIDVIVIDHHTVPVTLPAALAVINPHRDDCDGGAEDLCAVGVTFNVCAALRRTLRERGWFSSTRPEPDLREEMDLVALGTVADVVPLVGDNRAFVRFGLQVIDRGRRPGMQSLVNVARLRGPKVTAGHLGFQLGPRINAAGRLGDAMKAVRLFRTLRGDEADRLAQGLDEENLARRDLERRITEEARAQVEASPEMMAGRAIVVGHEGWHPGVVGIVASRLTDRFGKPAVVVGEGGRGSGRSIPKYHLYDGIAACADELEGFGGHQHAAGVRVRAGRLDAFRDKLLAHAADALAPTDLGRRVLYDGTLDVAAVDDRLVDELEKAAPYGRKNPEPVFRFNRVEPKGVRELSGGHFKCVLRERPFLEAIVFGQGERLDEFTGPLDLLGVVEASHFRGTRTLQLRVRDFRASEGS